MMVAEYSGDLPTKKNHTVTDTDKRKNQRGFSLVELLVVIVILGVLSTIVAVNVLPAGDKARRQAAKTQVDALDAALRQYQLDMGSFPTTDEGLTALVEAPTNHRRLDRYREGGYLAKPTLPEDPWGNPYHYQFPGEFGVFDVYSLGRDGKPGGNGLDADVGNWE
ncbi:MAG: type II secretion system major pseudopilin GspG [Parvularcula sp.]